MTRHDFPSRFEAVLVDLQVLVDFETETAAALNAALAQSNRPAVCDRLVRTWIGGGPDVVVREALALLDVVDGEPRPHLVRERFDRHCQRLAGTRSGLRAGVRETLHALRASQVPMGVIGAEEGDYARALLSAHRIAHLFDASAFGDAPGEGKPGPAPVRHCLRELRTVAPRALFVGRSVLDVTMARNAGLAVWVVDDEGGAGGLEADRAVGCITDVVRALRSPQVATIERTFAARRV